MEYSLFAYLFHVFTFSLTFQLFECCDSVNLSPAFELTRKYKTELLFVLLLLLLLLKHAFPFSKILSLLIPSSILRDFPMFGVCPSNKHCPSARCAYAANVVGKDLDKYLQSEAFLSITFYTHLPKIVNTRNTCS
jgi:hypothetical protein